MSLSFEEFTEKFCDVLDEELDLTKDTHLDSIDAWDSLSVIKFAVVAKTQGVNLHRSQINGVKTVGELYSLLGDN